MTKSLFTTEPQGTHTLPINRHLLQQAADWFALLRDDTATASQRRQWQAWLTAHPDHARAWAEVGAIGTSFAQLAETDLAHAARAVLNRSGQSDTRLSRRNALKLLGVGGIVLLTGALGARHSAWRDWTTVLAASTTHCTAVGETRSVTLAEGTRVWINTATHLEATLSFALRRIDLQAGEVLVQSSADSESPARPLVVDTVHGRLTALGTRFAVRLEHEQSLLSVFDGAVEIATDSSATRRIINAGEQSQFNRHEISPLQAADPARAAWTHGILLADNRRLDHFIRELATHRRGTLAVAPDVAHLRLVGAYPLRDTGRVLKAIEASLPVRLRQTGPQAWILGAR